MLKNTIKCKLCGLICSMQVSASHLRSAHSMTTKDYRALGYKTLSPARLEQLRNSPVAKGNVRRLYGEEHWNWKGGHVTSAGYRIISKRGKHNLYEHRVVAEEMIGRPLESDEVVHHIDGNRSNNSTDNLVVMKRKQHDKDKQRTKHFFYTHDPYVKKAAHALHGIGWSQTQVSRALRIHNETAKRWLQAPVQD